MSVLVEKYREEGRSFVVSENSEGKIIGKCLPVFLWVLSQHIMGWGEEEKLATKVTVRKREIDI